MNWGEEAVTRLVISVSLIVILLGLMLFGLSDTAISIGDICVPENEVTGSVGKPNNSSASAMI